MIKEHTVPKQRPSFVRAATLVAVLFGLILRIRQFAANRSLWLDEALLALNLTERNLVELAQPLDYNQGAPLGFLFVQKLVLEAFGNRDYILRLLPLAAGIISLYLIYRVAEHYTTGAAIPLAVALFAVSVPQIYFASEAKQYATDVAVCLLLLLVVASCFGQNVGMKHYVGLGVVGSLALWFSHPALFVVGGAGLGLALHLVVSRDWRRLSWLGGVCLTWLANFAAVYLVSLSSLSSNATLIGYWDQGFMPLPPWQDWDWFPTAILGLFENPGGLSVASVALGAFLVGCLSLLRRQWQLGLVLVLPFVLVILASGLRKYPFADRLLLFLMPSAFLLIAQGVEQTRLTLQRTGTVISSGVWLALAITLLAAPTNESLQVLWQPQQKEEIKEVMQYLNLKAAKGEYVYVYYGAFYPFLYYADQFGFGREDYMLGQAHRDEPDKYVKHLDQLCGQGRIWFIFSHVYDSGPVDEEAFFLEHLDRLGNRVDEFTTVGASTYLYDLPTCDQ